MKIKTILYLLTATLLFTSCDDTIIETYVANVPIYLTFEELRSSVVSESARELESPGKIYFYEDYLFVNGLNKI